MCQCNNIFSLQQSEWAVLARRNYRICNRDGMENVPGILSLTKNGKNDDKAQMAASLSGYSYTNVNNDK